MLGKQGWRLAPAFDVNPNTDKEAHVLNLDEADNRPSLVTVLATADYYRLKATAAKAILQEVRTLVRQWETAAKRLGLPAEERLEMAGAFAAAVKNDDFLRQCLKA